MKDGMLEMKDIITKEEKCMLYRDEVQDDFLITPWCEIFIYSNSTLGVYCFSWKKLLWLRRRGVIFDVQELDEPFTLFYTDRSNLHLILSLGRFKKRPHYNGKFLNRMRRDLAHEIHRYNPVEYGGQSEYLLV